MPHGLRWVRVATKNFLWAVAATALMSCPAQAATDFGNTVLGATDLPRGVFSIEGDTFQSVASAGRYFASLNDAAKPRSEAETYAMLLAGLGLMGFIARRRNKVLNAAD